MRETPALIISQVLLVKWCQSPYIMLGGAFKFGIREMNTSYAIYKENIWYAKRLFFEQYYLFK